MLLCTFLTQISLRLARLFVQEQSDQTHKLGTPLWPLILYIGDT